MPIEHNNGCTVVTGDAINFLQIVAQRGVVRMELAGLKGRGPVLWRRLRDHYKISGIKGRKASHQQVLDWLNAKIEELRPQQVHVTKEGGRTVVEVEGREVN